MKESIRRVGSQKSDAEQDELNKEDKKKNEINKIMKENEQNA